MAVEDGDTDLDLRNLPVEVPRHQAVARQLIRLDTVHPALDTALRWSPLHRRHRGRHGARPSHRDARLSRCIDRLVPGDRPCDCGFPRPGILAWWHDAMSATLANRIMALARVMRPLGD